jgi:hypothetical protein
MHMFIRKYFHDSKSFGLLKTNGYQLELLVKYFYSRLGKGIEKECFQGSAGLERVESLMQDTGEGTGCSDLSTALNNTEQIILFTFSDEARSSKFRRRFALQYTSCYYLFM